MAAGFQFRDQDTAARQVERLVFGPADVTGILPTHGDPDHAGGLADFPHARVHLAAEELDALRSENPRYRPPQFAHGPRWVPHPRSEKRWFGLETRPVTTRDSRPGGLGPAYTRGAASGRVVVRCSVQLERKLAAHE